MSIFYEKANSAVNKHISSILTAMFAVILPVLVFAGDVYIDRKIKIATFEGIKEVKQMVMDQRIDYIQDKIYALQDKEIDGIITKSEKKRLIRLEAQMKQLRIAR